MSDRSAILLQIGTALSHAGVLIRELALEEQVEKKLGKVLSYEHAAAVMDCSKATISRLVRDKQLDSVKVGRMPKVPVSSIEAYKLRRRTA